MRLLILTDLVLLQSSDGVDRFGPHACAPAMRLSDIGALDYVRLESLSRLGPTTWILKGLLH